MDNHIQPRFEEHEIHGKLIPLNAFGFGGSNCHLILKRNEKSVSQDLSSPRLVNLCNRSKEGIDAMTSFIKYHKKEVTPDFLALLNDFSKQAPETGMFFRSSLILDEKKKNHLARIKRNPSKAQRIQQFYLMVGRSLPIG